MLSKLDQCQTTQQNRHDLWRYKTLIVLLVLLVFLLVLLVLLLLLRVFNIIIKINIIISSIIIYILFCCMFAFFGFLIKTTLSILEWFLKVLITTHIIFLPTDQKRAQTKSS